MSKQKSNQNEIRVQFVESKENDGFRILKTIFELYPFKKESQSVRNALRDLVFIYEFFDSKTLPELLKKISGDRNYDQRQNQN